MSRKGLTLVEVMVALAVTGIIAAPFLSVFVQLSKVSRYSRNNLTASYASSNKYETLKGMTVQELASLPAGIRDSNGGYLCKTSLTAYEGASVYKKDSIDIVAKDADDGSFICYLLTDCFPVLPLIRGSGQINAEVHLNDDSISICMSADGGVAAQTDTIASDRESPYAINVYLQKLSGHHTLNMIIDGSLERDVALNIYERPLQCGEFTLKYNGLEYKTDQHSGSIFSDNVSIHNIKTDRNNSALIAAEVRIYENTDIEVPVSVRKGIIKAAH